MPITLFDALKISVASMLVVFTVLFLLYVVLRLFPVIFRERSVIREKRDQSAELAAAIAAALHMYRQNRRRYPNPMARGGRAGRHTQPAAAARNPMARNCRRLV